MKFCKLITLYVPSLSLPFGKCLTLLRTYPPHLELFCSRCFTCSDFKPSNKSCRLNAASRVNPLAQELEFTLIVGASQLHLLTESIQVLYSLKKKENVSPGYFRTLHRSVHFRSALITLLQ